MLRIGDTLMHTHGIRSLGLSLSLFFFFFNIFLPSPKFKPAQLLRTQVARLSSQSVSPLVHKQ